MAIKFKCKPTHRIASYVAWEPAMNRVVLEHVCHVLAVDEGVVDSYHLNIVTLHGCTGHQATDPAKT